MNRLSLLSAVDVQMSLAGFVQARRKALRLSRAALAVRSTVPAATIKKFETTGQISLRQLVLLWQCVDDLARLDGLCKAQAEAVIPPKSIAEVLAR